MSELAGTEAMWVDEDDAELTDSIMAELMTPSAWRVLVRPRAPKRKTAGGLFLPGISIDAQGWTNYLGQIVKTGPMAFMAPKLGYVDRDGNPIGDRKRPGAGDWICYGQHAGQKITYRGLRFLIINDDEALGVWPEGFAPERVKVYVD